MADEKPTVLIIGAASHVGAPIAQALADSYALVGMDTPGSKADIAIIDIDLTTEASVGQAFAKFREAHGGAIASVIHLSAFYDFSGEDNPLYRRLNVEGVRRVLAALQSFKVEQFVYAGTMLVYEPAAPGVRIDESRPIEPRWIYPRSKAEAEEVIRRDHGAIPYVLLQLAGLYSGQALVPTLAHQIARIYERAPESHLYPGDPEVTQALVHAQDMAEAFRRAVDRRGELPKEAAILIGEPDTPCYRDLQNAAGHLIHGEDWPTLQVPAAAAAVGAWAEEKAGQALGGKEQTKPFIRPYMMKLASDNYRLDITRAKALLGWSPKHRILEELPGAIAKLKKDPAAWFKANKIEPPANLASGG